MDGAGVSHSVDAATGAGGDAAGDRYFGITTFVGSPGNDTFYGTADHPTTFFGGAGDDSFYLKSGDVAIGGPGADSFYIDTSENGLFEIVGMDADDKLYVNGVLYTGRTKSSEVVDVPSGGSSIWQEESIVSDNSAYGVAYGPASSSAGNLRPVDAVRYDQLHLGRTDGGTGDLNGFAAISFQDNRTGEYSQLFIAGFHQGDAGIHQSLEEANYTDVGSDTFVNLVNTDGNTPGDVYNGDIHYAWASWTDYSWMGPAYA